MEPYDYIGKIKHNAMLYGIEISSTEDLIALCEVDFPELCPYLYQDPQLAETILEAINED